MKTLGYYIYSAMRPVFPLDHPPQEVKAEKITKLQKESGYSVFIETGTYKGDMIESQKNNFVLLYSIELGSMLAKRARKRFSRQSHVHIYQGDSAKLLGRILTNVGKPCIFWLDAHYSGGVTAKNTQNTPIMAELKVILSSKKLHHIILIDDARLFTGKNDYPTMTALKKLVRTSRPEARIYRADDMICIYI